MSNHPIITAQRALLAERESQERANRNLRVAVAVAIALALLAGFFAQLEAQLEATSLENQETWVLK